MQSQAYRELAAAQMFGYGLQFVPELQVAQVHDLAHPRGDRALRGRREDVRGVHRRERRARGARAPRREADRRSPTPGSSWRWRSSSTTAAASGSSRSTRTARSCPTARSSTRSSRRRRATRRSASASSSSCARAARYEDVKQAVFEKWLRQGLLSFGRPGTEGARTPSRSGLKKRDPAPVMQDFLDDIKPAVAARGLACRRSTTSASKRRRSVDDA